MDGTLEQQGLDPLTERELDILRLMADGLSNRELAHELVITYGTVKWYNRQIYSKLGVHSRDEAVAKARILGLLGTHEDEDTSSWGRDASREKYPIRYARSGDVNIAYQVIGDGPFDLVYVSGWVSHLEHGWEHPAPAHFYQRLASFSRLIFFDKRGTGLSDRTTDLPTLEQRMDDVRAVMDAAGSERAALFGMSEGATMCILFAATYPERTIALLTFGAFAKRIWSPDYPWAPTPEERQEWLDLVERDWGGVVDIDILAPSAAKDEEFSRWWATYLRRSASPGAALALGRMNTEIDVRHVLPTIRVPTLVLHRTGDLELNVEEGRFIAERIPEAKFVELPGVDHLIYAGDIDSVLDEVEGFLSEDRPSSKLDRVLATVLFTEMIVAGNADFETEDGEWRDLLDTYRSLVRRETGRFRGREIRQTSQGLVVAFDGPSRAIKCAEALRDSAMELGIEIKAGLHTGECEMTDDGLGGVAVEVAAGILAHAQGGDVLVSSTVKDIVAGAGIQFEDQGPHTFKGTSGEWHLFRVK